MWHQYGVEPSASDGISLEIQSPSTYLRNSGRDANARDLSQLLAFGKTHRATKIGSLADQGTLSEAIVAIPFKYLNNSKRTELYKMDQETVGFVKNCTMPVFTGKYEEGPGGSHGTNLIPIMAPELVFKESLGRYGGGLIKDYRKTIPVDPPEGVDGAIYNLLRLMRKYVLPPHLDFLHYDDVEPFVMYMWDFEVKLGKQDLQNIWQNVSPAIGTKTIKATSDIITHVLPTRDVEASEGVSIPSHPYFAEVFDADKTRWAVFKVKKRGRNNYLNVVGRKTIHMSEAQYIREDVTFPHDFAFSYNWPHDFFSLIELGKVTAATTFNPQEPGKATSTMAKQIENLAGVFYELSKQGVPVPPEEKKAAAKEKKKKQKKKKPGIPKPKAPWEP